VSCPPSFVTPAKSPDQVRGGVQGDQRALATLDPGFRRDDVGVVTTRRKTSFDWPDRTGTRAPKDRFGRSTA